MNGLRRYIDKIKPQFEKGGKFAKLQSTFEAFETFLFVPDKVTFKGSHIRDAIDLKRTMSVVIMAMIFNALAQNTAIDWISYAVYLILISVPTLIFIMALSFLLMSVIRNQAITFVLILGYIGITLFLFQAKYYYILDYMAFNIPMLSSDIVGFGNIAVILAHRGIYFGLGMGFIFLTIFLLKRLPQSDSMTIFSLLFGIIFIAGGAYLGYQHINQFKQSEKLRENIIALKLICKNQLSMNTCRN